MEDPHASGQGCSAPGKPFFESRERFLLGPAFLQRLDVAREHRGQPRRFRRRPSRCAAGLLLISTVGSHVTGKPFAPRCSSSPVAVTEADSDEWVGFLPGAENERRRREPGPRLRWCITPTPQVLSRSPHLLVNLRSFLRSWLGEFRAFNPGAGTNRLVHRG